jgi:hypothetical protein
MILCKKYIQYSFIDIFKTDKIGINVTSKGM